MTPAPPPTAPPGRVPGPLQRRTARTAARNVTRTATGAAARAATRTATRAAACAAAVALLLTACGPDGDGPKGSHHGGKTAAGAVRTPTATAPVPHGKGSRLPDDLNGDGYPDLQLPVASGKVGLPSRIAFVHGSADGLDPATRTVLGHKALGLPSDDVTVAGATEVATADLDGDGYADVTTTAGERLGKRETARVHATVRTVPYVSWGGPGGPRQTRSAARVQLTGPEDGVDPQRPTVGDFNGDGHHDLALVRADRHSLLLLYGPFNRAGKAARTVPYDSPLHEKRGEIGDLVADRIDGHRATDLVVHTLNDDEQSSSTLLTATRHGLSSTGRRLREGNAITFGDFDGDGRRDVAVGDSGTRNTEPGDETEKPDIGKTVSVYTKGAAHRTGSFPYRFKIPKMSGALAAADTDGDGTDELAVSLGRGGVELLTLRSGSSPRSKSSSTSSSSSSSSFSEGLGGIARRHTLTRAVPARVDGKTVRKGGRAARLYGVADFDHDGKDEVVLAWGRGLAFSRYGERPERWWITDGAADETAFTSKPFAADGHRHAQADGQADGPADDKATGTAHD
ncbi:VCBS repeat-containing protein [Streptomyces sp. NPDC005355]|uniref:FG-GAP repeat domain-containing protein n=1 Tax=Streptomyces sp. NPDC005355 TaxID=3157038 RepID=UPI00339FF568